MQCCSCEGMGHTKDGTTKKKWDNTSDEDRRWIWRHRPYKSSILIWKLEKLQEQGHAFTTAKIEVQSDD